MSLPKFLNGKVEDFHFHGDRYKVDGRMWGGYATASIGEVRRSVFKKLYGTVDFSVKTNIFSFLLGECIGSYIKRE